MIKYKPARIFKSGTELEIFRDNYCYNSCKFHKLRADGFPEYPEYGGCTIEDKIELARFDSEEFPNVLREAWEDGKCLERHHCPFYISE